MIHRSNKIVAERLMYLFSFLIRTVQSPRHRLNRAEVRYVINSHVSDCPNHGNEPATQGLKASEVAMPIWYDPNPKVN